VRPGSSDRLVCELGELEVGDSLGNSDRQLGRAEGGVGAPATLGPDNIIDFGAT
jgi:hypothetical protein